MALDIGLNQLFTPIWQVINIDGTPLSGGGVFFFDAEDHDVARNVYIDATGTTAWPNPITLNAQGIASIGTATYGIYGSGLYYIEVRETTDRTSALIFSQDNYRAPQLPLTPPEPPYFSDIDIRNFILNGQFTLHGQDYNTSGVSVPDSIMDLAPGGWVFIKNDTSSNDSITFQPFVYGQTDVPAQPLVYFQYQCNSISETESLKYIGYRIINYGNSSVNNNQNFGNTPGSGVSTLNGQTVTFQFEGISSSNSAITFSVYQYFGANGSAPVLTSIHTFNLINQWSSTEDGFPESIQFTMPSIAGKTIDPSGGDYVELRFNLPLNSSSSIGISNVSLQNLSLLVGFQPQPINQLISDISAFESPAITTNSQMYKDGNYFEMLQIGNTTKSLIPCAGKIVQWGSNTPPDYALICDGKSYYSSEYYNLAQTVYSSIDSDNVFLNFGSGINGFSGNTGLTSTATITCFTNGEVIAGSAGTSGFTFVQISIGSVSTKAEVTVTCLDAENIDSGSYFLLNSPGQEYYVWFSFNNSTSDPGDFLTALSDKRGIKVIYTGSESEEQIALLVMQQCILSHYRIPDFRGLFTRMPNFGATAVFPILSKLTATSSANLSGITYTIIGLDVNSEPVTVMLAGPNNNTVETTEYFTAITSITPDATNSNAIEMGSVDDSAGIAVAQGSNNGVPLILNGVWSRDIDYSSRSFLYVGGTEFDSVGSFQVDQNLSHTHEALTRELASTTNANASCFTSPNATAINGAATTEATGGHQANPKNVYINYIIYF